MCREQTTHVFSFLLQMSCQACQTSIEGSGVTALGKSFHKACFVCEGCHRGFDKGRFAVGDDEKPYHEECLGDKDTPVSSSTPCDECGKAIGEGHILRTGWIDDFFLLPSDVHQN